ncbi:MAG: SPFH domain-containing protein [Candidatus Moraniibacteriota bacterium]
MEMNWVKIIITVVSVTAVLGMLVGIIASAFFTIKQQTMGVIERFGKFIRIADPGLGFKIAFVDQVAGRPSLQVQELSVPVETKTRDNVFVTIKVSVMYYILTDKVNEAWYKLRDPRNQIMSYVLDVIRSQVPDRDLDDVFTDKDAIANSVKAKLDETMKQFGYAITNTLVTDIDPDAKVKASMNEINAAQRLRVAAQEKGEAEKILAVKKAEAEKETKRLQGEGIADQRKAIANGFKESVDMLKESTGAEGGEVMRMLMITQHYDMLNNVASSGNSSVIMLPYVPGAINDIQSQLTEALLVSKQVGKEKVRTTE